jgi:hypothetical protein
MASPRLPPRWSVSCSRLSAVIIAPVIFCKVNAGLNAPMSVAPKKLAISVTLNWYGCLHFTA